MRPPTPRRTTSLAAVLLAVLATTACISVPDEGPVVSVDDRVGTQPEVGIERLPAPPQEGQSAQNIVTGFLQAMTAYPVRTEVARLFLASGARDAWDPSKIVTYESRDSLKGTDVVKVRLHGAHWIDSRGTWRGERGSGDVSLSFPIVEEDDEFRIASVPDALFVPDTWFHDRYRSASVFYFDPTGSILVPEQVFVRTDQVAGSLVQALLDGPGPELRHVVRSFVPPGLTPGLSVPVSDDGQATITLEGDVGPVTAEDARLLVYQFAWTLQQDPSITSFSITLNGQPLTLSGSGGTEFSVDLGSEYTPAYVQASSALFALRDGLLETGGPGTTAPVTGPLGSTVYGVKSVAVSLKADLAATVSGGGTALALTSVNDGSHPYTEVVSGASRLLTPSWDFADRLWVVDLGPSGARVSLIDTSRDDTKVIPVNVPGISGEVVKDFMVSRDGTRLVAVVRGRDADSLRVARIRYDSLGRLRRPAPVSQSRNLAWGAGDPQRIRDIGWRTPSTVGVLHQFTPTVAQFVAVPVDGSTGLVDRLTQAGRALALVSSPADDETLYIRTGAGLEDTTGAEGGNLVPLPREVRSVRYVG
jgi:hypothetical protein